MKVIAGPCAIESYLQFFNFAHELKEAAEDYPIDLTIKGSFDKANRTRLGSPRGVGLEMGLLTLRDVQKCTGLPVTTDVHEVCQVEKVAQVVDIVQIPAFLSRQTDLLSAASASGAQVNVKIGPWMGLNDVLGVLTKVPEAWLTYRGTSMGPDRLVVDPIFLEELWCEAAPVLLDLTHPNRGRVNNSMALSLLAPLVDGVFVEVHSDPKTAISDADNQLSISQFRYLLDNLCS